jgi:hypothetical protein
VLTVLKSNTLSLFIKNNNLVYTNKPFVSNLICYCEFTKYLFYNNTLVLIILVHCLNVNLKSNTNDGQNSGDGSTANTGRTERYSRSPRSAECVEEYKRCAKLKGQIMATEGIYSTENEKE